VSLPSTHQPRGPVVTAGVDLRRFYEAHPYQCTGTELASLIEGRRAVVGDPQRWFHLYFPDQPYREGLDALVVGCRNLEAARLAAGASRTRFLALDHEETTLDQLDRLKQHYRLDNLDLMWLGPDQIPVLDRHFDLVFCPQGLPATLGPPEFLRMVRERLAGPGSLNLCVGGRHGGLGVRLLRQMLTAAGIDFEAADAATFRQWVETLPPSHPFQAAAAELPELNHDAGLLDALRACEPAFSVVELQRLLETSGLRLQRFLCQAPYMPQCSGLAALPFAAATSGTAGWDCLAEAYALTELFRGNLRTHTLIACRDDRPARSHAVNFAGHDWLCYKPIRNPGLEIQTDDLPAGGVARLRWDAHDDPGIFLIVDANQARLFDAIDGACSILEILEAGKPDTAAPEEFARAFFETLWRYDYAWFQIPSAAADNAETGSE
jgi:hypothetical protein